MGIERVRTDKRMKRCTKEPVSGHYARSRNNTPQNQSSPVRATVDRVRSTKELVKELRQAPQQWMDAAIVIVFEDHFEFVSEDSPFPVTKLTSLENKGGLPIGLAGMRATADSRGAFCVQVFKEYESQDWAHQYMARLRKMVQRHSKK